jgi:predicted metal-dependent phosphoesterase TrpH
VLLAAAARPGSSVGRPQVARELVRAGYVTSVQDAFDKWLATGKPAFINRTGPSPATIVDAIHDAGGIASMAHPGVTKRDELIGPLAEHGLDAIEVYHSDHAPEDQYYYRLIAERHGLLISGGSDFHGEDPAVPARMKRGILGVVSLPPDAFAALEDRARARR